MFLRVHESCPLTSSKRAGVRARVFRPHRVLSCRCWGKVRLAAGGAETRLLIGYARTTAVDVYPSLTYPDVEAALAFLTEAFGLTVDEIGRRNGRCAFRQSSPWQ